MFGTGKGFFGALIGLIIFSIIVFFVIYLLVPDVSIRFFGISVNSDEYIDQSIGDAISSLDLPEEIISDFQEYVSSPDGEEFINNVTTAMGNQVDKIMLYVNSDLFKEQLQRAGEAVASGAESFSEFFTSHPVTE